MTENEINSLTPLPEYQSHKKVCALKIRALEINQDGSATLATEEFETALITAPGWAGRFKGEEGGDLGYWVQYEDGYQSWSPSEAFESGYTRILSEEEKIEHEIKEKGLTAPRLTPKQIDNTILGEQYHIFPGTTVTVCCLTLQNGFCVIGHSAAASPENFDIDIGMKIAREDARQNIWPLEGYLLRQRLHEHKIMREQDAAEASTREIRKEIGLEGKELLGRPAPVGLRL